MSDGPNNVVDLTGRLDHADITECECGGEWFTARVALTDEGKVRAYAHPLVCIECGRELPRPEETR